MTNRFFPIFEIILIERRLNGITTICPILLQKTFHSLTVDESNTIDAENSSILRDQLRKRGVYVRKGRIILISDAAHLVVKEEFVCPDDDNQGADKTTTNETEVMEKLKSVLNQNGTSKSALEVAHNDTTGSPGTKTTELEATFSNPTLVETEHIVSARLITLMLNTCFSWSNVIDLALSLMVAPARSPLR